MTDNNGGTVAVMRSGQARSEVRWWCVSETAECERHFHAVELVVDGITGRTSEARPPGERLLRVRTMDVERHDGWMNE
jgi:hypothetical protein